MATWSASSLAAAPPATFTYQGQLKQEGVPVNGTFDFRFTLFSPDVVLNIPAFCARRVPVVNGLFTVEIEFPAPVFDGTSLAMHVDVSPNPVFDCTSNTLPDPFTRLVPPQPITPTPYATTALSALSVPGIDGHSLDASDGDPADALFVNSAGNVGIGTVTPGGNLHVRPQSIGATAIADSTLVLEKGGNNYLTILASGTKERGIVFGEPGNSQAAGIYYDNATVPDGLQFRVNGNSTKMVVTLSGDVGIGEAAPGARLDVRQAGNRVALFNRTGDDGVLVNWQREGFNAGSVSVAAGVVSYNAFTGSHYAWSESGLEPGVVVSMTGNNRRYDEQPGGEVVYGVMRTSTANDPACLGVYVNAEEPSKTPGAANPLLVAAVGNGDMWVVDRAGGDIEPGDYLISSDVAGRAMKDDPSRFPIGHIIARAAERVRWADVPADGPSGVRHRRISVLFESFVRNHTADRLAAEVRELREALETQRREFEAMRLWIRQDGRREANAATSVNLPDQR